MFLKESGLILLNYFKIPTTSFSYKFLKAMRLITQFGTRKCIRENQTFDPANILDIAFDEKGIRRI